MLIGLVYGAKNIPSQETKNKLKRKLQNSMPKQIVFLNPICKLSMIFDFVLVLFQSKVDSIFLFSSSYNKVGIYRFAWLMLCR